MSSNNQIDEFFQKGEDAYKQKDYQEAMKWYQKPADLGDAVAMNTTGYMYQYGLGVQKDYQEAMKWYQKSSDLGNNYGILNLKYTVQTVPSDYFYQEIRQLEKTQTELEKYKKELEYKIIELECTPGTGRLYQEAKEHFEGTNVSPDISADTGTINKN